MSVSKKLVNPTFEYKLDFDIDIVRARASDYPYDMGKDNLRKVFDAEVELLSNFLTIDKIKILINYLIGVYEGAFVMDDPKFYRQKLGDYRHTVIDGIRFDYLIDKDKLIVSFNSDKDVDV